MSDMNEDGTLNIPAIVPYEDRMKEETADQATMTRDQVRDSLENKVDDTGKKVFEHVFDPETAVAPNHRWVDRGLVMSCEGANHPNHRHFKVGRK